MEDIPGSLKPLCVCACVSSPPAAPVVNDGGLSWLRKSYQRMKEQAEMEQRSLDEVVSERYGVRTDGTRSHTHLARVDTDE